MVGNIYAKFMRHTIARDLTIGLILTITLVFGLAGLAHYFYSVQRDTSALYKEADEIMDNLASVLGTPMWDLNSEELQKIVRVYRQSGIVMDIALYNEDGEILVPSELFNITPFLEMKRTIYQEDKAIGNVLVSFSDENIVQKQREVFEFTALLFFLLSLALIGASSFLLRRFVRDPFAKLKSGLDVLSGGDYTHRLSPIKQQDINDITEAVNSMAKEIARRETALEQNRANLETLNQAILDIFSCSDTNTLIRTAMVLTNKVCNVDHGLFLAKIEGSQEDEDTSNIPKSLVCVRGHLFEASQGEVEPHIGRHDDKKVFSFEVKSRNRVVGRMTLEFDEQADSTTRALLKSLMSLVTLAMIRQSFIRETAFIAAELQVAETVQRSMLPDETRPAKSAIVAYHYEPVLRVGGDLFNIIESKDGRRLYVILGDVTGHGLAQGLVTTAVAGALNMTEAMIREYDDTALRHPSQIVSQLNKLICKIAGKSNLHMTCVVARIDFLDMKIELCNAGHTFPILLQKKRDDRGSDHWRIRSLAQNQQHMLGDQFRDGADRKYHDAEYSFCNEDVMIFYTDGLTDAVDANGRSFHRKFLRYLSKNIATKLAADQLKNQIINLLQQHTDRVPVKDDICLLILSKRTVSKSVTAA